MPSDQDPAIALDQKAPSFHPLLFYALSFAIAWIAWAPLLLHKLWDVALPIPYPVALFICQTIGAFAPLLSLLLMRRLTNDPDLVKRVFRKLRFRR